MGSSRLGLVGDSGIHQQDTPKFLDLLGTLERAVIADDHVVRNQN